MTDRPATRPWGPSPSRISSRPATGCRRRIRLNGEVGFPLPGHAAGKVRSGPQQRAPRIPAAKRLISARRVPRRVPLVRIGVRAAAGARIYRPDDRQRRLGGFTSSPRPNDRPPARRTRRGAVRRRLLRRLHLLAVAPRQPASSGAGRVRASHVARALIAAAGFVTSRCCRRMSPWRAARRGLLAWRSPSAGHPASDRCWRRSRARRRPRHTADRVRLLTIYSGGIVVARSSSWDGSRLREPPPFRNAARPSGNRPRPTSS